MLEGFTVPVMSGAKPQSFTQCFACLAEIIHHPQLQEEEKYAWLWLATFCAHKMLYLDEAFPIFWLSLFPSH